MALKYALASKAEWEALPEAMRTSYVEKDGKFVLDVEGGAVPSSEKLELQTKLAEFRDNNKKLFKEVEELKKLEDTVKKFEGIDPERYREMESEVGELKKRGVTKPEDINEAIKRAVEAATKPIQEALKAEKESRERAQREADSSVFRELVQTEATKASVRPSALRHIIREAEALFELKDKQIVPKDGVKHPTEPLSEYSPSAWLQHLAKSDDYLFEPSNGGGAPGTNGGNGLRPTGKVLRNPSAEDLGKFVDELATGKMTIVRD